MDAVECMKAVTRMLKSGTIDCAIQKYISAQKKNDYEGMVEAAEQWAAEHPAKTRQSVFLEQYPEANLTEDGVLALCPMAISSEYRGENDSCVACIRTCDDCRRKFWLAEVENAEAK